VSDVCCQVEFSVSGWSLVQRNPTGLVFVRDRECDQQQQYVPTPTKIRQNEARLWKDESEAVLRDVSESEFLIAISHIKNCIK
jgi:hypothetical protein